ncbi:MAG: gliding motility lipoprotein GldH [Bacteroidetes bacterium]|jgi:gliding motility-associated lipoprotein GldH|nr:gliding motility lipoprotein GldH [Bacteroidota bacterium]MCK4360329.1 gliding motility lipoprotein GldH [Bacteroidales bacterium]MCK4407213.1 gliding motility lipoprotein GldH [Bacteroidales bacterium]MCK4637907.1 gliding motility lipoprotein GldH [Bacteroidales bacterium]
MNFNNPNKNYKYFLILLLLFASCDSNTVYDKNLTVGTEWNKNDVLEFEVEITDTTSLYKYFINIRNSTDYKFRNIYFFLNTRFPDGRRARDTIECILASTDGRWLGSGLGDIKSNRILLKNKIKFPQAGNYKFELEQAMRVDNLQGIEDVGIRIEKE